MTNIIIRPVRPDDLDRVAAIEAACFPAAEAAPRESFHWRIATFPDCFFVAEAGGKLIGFINGCATNSPVIVDEMFHDPAHHLPGGENASIFGLDVVPEQRRRGVAAGLLRHFIAVAGAVGRKRVILTCKQRLVPYYESFGFQNDGLSASTHGGAEWYDMTLIL